MSRIKEITIESVKTTSLKGFPKLINSTEWSLKILWTIGLILLLAMGLYQVETITSEYFSYPTITTITEETLELIGKDAVRIPDILLCNLNPHGSETSDVNGIPSVAEYTQVVENLTACDKETPCTPLKKERLALLREALMIREGYFQYIGQEAAQKVGLQLEKFMADCSVFVYTGSSSYEKACDGIIKFELHPHVSFYQCVEVHFPEQSIEQLIVGISFTLYLDNFIDPFNTEEFFKTGKISQQGSGVYVVLYEPGTFPIYMSEYSYASAGMATQISYGIKSISRLGEPYGNCTSYGKADHPNILGKNVSYTSIVCRAQCIGKEIMKWCGCIDVLVSHNIFLDKEYPYCYSAKLSRAQIIKNFECSVRVTISEAPNCYSMCGSPCNENGYPQKISTVQWPRPTLYHTLYKKIIKDKPYAWKFSGLKKDCTDYLNCTINEIQRQKFLIENNFAKVNIILGDAMHVKITDHQKVSGFSFMAQLGGALNLWNGITVVVVIEVLEYILKLCIYKKKKKMETELEVKAKADSIRKELFISSLFCQQFGSPHNLQRHISWEVQNDDSEKIIQELGDSPGETGTK